MRKKQFHKDSLTPNEDGMTFSESQCFQEFLAANTCNRIFVEVGMGRGTLLTAYAQKYPDTLCIGIEMKSNRVFSAVKKAQKYDLKNVTFLSIDVHDISQFFREKQVDMIWVTFPDPWPKTRHLKRRMTHETVLKQYGNILKSDGIFALKTDNPLVFNFTKEVCDEYKMLYKESINIHTDPNPLWKSLAEFETDYEQKYQKEGKSIFGIEVQGRDLNI